MIVVRGCAFPQDRYYHADYNVWLQRTAADRVTLGATAYGAALAIEFFAFTPKAIDTLIEPGRAVGLLELSKTVVSVRSPLAGRLLEVNRAAVERPALIAQDPYGAGWLVRLSTTADLATLPGVVEGEGVREAFDQAMTLENFEGVRSA